MAVGVEGAGRVVAVAGGGVGEPEEVRDGEAEEGGEGGVGGEFGEGEGGVCGRREEERGGGGGAGGRAGATGPVAAAAGVPTGAGGSAGVAVLACAGVSAGGDSGAGFFLRKKLNIRFSGYAPDADDPGKENGKRSSLFHHQRTFTCWQDLADDRRMGETLLLEDGQHLICAGGGARHQQAAAGLRISQEGPVGFGKPLW